MIVLNVFDGIACGRLALKRAKIKVEKYYSSEIDQNAIKIARKNFKDITELGSVLEWKNWKIDWKKIDLILAGPPCQAWSAAGKKQREKDPRGQLAFVFKELLEHAKKKNPKLKFLIENVRMNDADLKTWDNLFEVKHEKINSLDFSAQNRLRAYWTNIPIKPIKRKITDIKIMDIIDHGAEIKISEKLYASMQAKGFHLPEDLNTFITLGHRYLPFNFSTSGRGNGRVEGRTNWAAKSYTLTASPFSTRSYTGIYDAFHGKFRDLSVIEHERLQTLPDNFTEHPDLSEAQRKRLIGNGWTVDKIAHILRGLK